MALFFVTVFVLLALNVPVGFALGLTGLLVIVREGYDMAVMAQKFIPSIDNFLLLAVPFFLLAGRIMNSGGITRRLFNLANCFVGHITGGLAHVNILASMFFAGMSGSAVADAAGLGTIEIEAMTERGYGLGFTAAVTAASATIGPIIPPSIPMVIYAAIAEESILKLFLGGLIPGILIGLSLMFVSYVLARKRRYPVEPRATLKGLIKAFKESFFAILAPVIILGGILGGVCTATEASVIAVVYATVIGVFVYRELKLSDLPGLMLEAVVNTAAVMLIVGTASLVAWWTAGQRLPDLLTTMFTSVSTSPLAILLMINVLLLAVGCFLDCTPAIIIFAPCLVPVIMKAGFSPVYFGVIMVVNLCIGLLTPPVGTVLYAVSNISGLKAEKLAWELWPFLLAMVAVLALISLVPGLVMWIPSLVK